MRTKKADVWRRISGAVRSGPSDCGRVVAFSAFIRQVDWFGDQFTWAGESKRRDIEARKEFSLTVLPSKILERHNL